MAERNEDDGRNQEKGRAQHQSDKAAAARTLRLSLDRAVHEAIASGGEPGEQVIPFRSSGTQNDALSIRPIFRIVVTSRNSHRAFKEWIKGARFGAAKGPEAPPAKAVPGLKCRHGKQAVRRMLRAHAPFPRHRASGGLFKITWRFQMVASSLPLHGSQANPGLPGETAAQIGFHSNLNKIPADPAIALSQLCATIFVNKAP
ncbi:MAG: hypothetical protein ACTHJV_12535 [Rhizobiaceae bacterium]